MLSKMAGSQAFHALSARHSVLLDKHLALEDAHEQQTTMLNAAQAEVAATQALSDEIGTEMLATHQEEMFTGMISAIVGVLAAPLTENVMPRGGNLIVGLIVMIMTLEMALPLAGIELRVRRGEHHLT